MLRTHDGCHMCGRKCTLSGTPDFTSIWGSWILTSSTILSVHGLRKRILDCCFDVYGLHLLGDNVCFDCLLPRRCLCWWTVLSPRTPSPRATNASCIVYHQAGTINITYEEFLKQFHTGWYGAQYKKVPRGCDQGHGHNYHGRCPTD